MPTTREPEDLLKRLNSESDGKGFRQPPHGVCRNPFLFRVPGQGKERRMKKSNKKTVIAYRKSCRALGTGLSHYILMNKKAK
jgi:modified peptide precursor CbpA